MRIYTKNNTMYLQQLSEDEISEYLDYNYDFWYDRKIRFGEMTEKDKIPINDLNIGKNKSYDFPSKLWDNFVFNRINIHNIYLGDFPNLIFNFGGAKELILNRVPFSKVPKDWSSLASLEKLSFYHNDHIWEEFDFLDTLPNLKKMDSGFNFIRSPHTLIKKDPFPLYETSVLAFKDYKGPEGLPEKERTLMIPEKHLWQLVRSLGNSDLSKADQIAYYDSISHMAIYTTLGEIRPDLKRKPSRKEVRLFKEVIKSPLIPSEIRLSLLRLMQKSTIGRIRRAIMHPDISRFLKEG